MRERGGRDQVEDVDRWWEDGWTAPADVVWSYEADGRGHRLRSRATGGFLNVRRGGLLRGHGNRGPPWTLSTEREMSNEVELRLVPADVVRSRQRRETEPPHAVLSVDFHIATAQDVGHTLQELGIAFLDKSLSGACRRRGTCVSPAELPVLTKEAAFTLCPRPHALRRAAFAALHGSPLLEQTDAIVCSHPAALCEAWLPFNKGLLLIVTANLELARENPQRWHDWLRTIVAIAAAPRAVVAANNLYDLEYVHHFTGVTPLYLPTLANYVSARYRPDSAKPILFARTHHPIGGQLVSSVRRLLSQQLRRAQAERGAAGGVAGGAAGGLVVNVATIEEAYPGNAAAGGYELGQLATHPAIIYLPYTKSTSRTRLDPNPRIPRGMACAAGIPRGVPHGSQH